MNNLPICPNCSSEYTYEDRIFFICPECTYEWEKEAIENLTDTDKITEIACTIMKNDKVIP